MLESLNKEKVIAKEGAAETLLTFVAPSGETISYPDPYTVLVHKIEGQKVERTEQIRPDESIVLNVDLFQEAFRIGGLPLLRGNETLTKVEKSDKETKWGLRVDSVDLHDVDNIGNARAHGIPPFSQITITPAGGISVQFQDSEGSHTMDYESAKKYSVSKGLVEGDPNVFSITEVKKYLEDQRDFRVFTALMLNLSEPNGLGQMVWPVHADKDQSELGYISKQPDNEKPSLVIVKGGKAQGREGIKTDSYAAFIASDGSVVNMTEKNGYGMEVTSKSAGSELENLVENNGIKNIVVRGLAFTHCNKATAENLRLMQEISKLKTLIEEKTLVGIKEYLEPRVDAMKIKLAEIGITDISSELDTMVSLYNRYTKADLILDPSIKILIHIGHSDPVRIPNVPEDIQTGFMLSNITDYENMGVKVISDNYLSKN